MRPVTRLRVAAKILLTFAALFLLPATNVHASGDRALGQYLSSECVTCHQLSGRFDGIPPIVLTRRERAIVTLLAEGLTDSAVAERLQLSRRTIAYTLRALMDRIGVENRFQLGLTVGSMRLLEPMGEAR